MTLIRANLDEYEDYVLETCCRVYRKESTSKKKVSKEIGLRQLIRDFGEQNMDKMQVKLTGD